MKREQMRLFVAVTPPPEVADEVEAAISPYQNGYTALRWVGRERWHVSLSFLGEVDEEHVPDLRARLDEATVGHQSMVLSFAGAGAFPRARQARVLWTDVFGQRRELTALAAAVSTAAGRAGLRLDHQKRKFAPHLTLARCREPTDLRPLVDALSSYAGSPWTADTVHLVRSRLGPNPSYEAISSWPLLPGPGGSFGQ